MGNTYQKEVQTLIDRLIQHYKPLKIIAFGSFARGDMHEDSDLDLCIIKKDIPSSRVYRRFEVYQLLDDRNIPLDVVIYQPEEFEERRRLGDPFIKTILSEGKMLYG